MGVERAFPPPAPARDARLVAVPPVAAVPDCLPAPEAPGRAVFFAADCLPTSPEAVAADLRVDLPAVPAADCRESADLDAGACVVALRALPLPLLGD